jgi:hypothetical protein
VALGFAIAAPAFCMTPGSVVFANGDSKGYVAFRIACPQELLMFLHCGADDDRRRTPRVRKVQADERSRYGHGVPQRRP